MGKLMTVESRYGKYLADISGIDILLTVEEVVDDVSAVLVAFLEVVIGLDFGISHLLDEVASRANTLISLQRYESNQHQHICLSD